MKLSAPIFQLKAKAKVLAKDHRLPHHEALDKVAQGEGFPSWSLLAAKHAERSPAAQLYDQLNPGDLVLIAARPGQGKTLMGLQLAVQAMNAGNHSAFFSLEYTEKECLNRFNALGVDSKAFGSLFKFDGSDAICADYVAAKLAGLPEGTLAVIDYLQLLDQNRRNPDLMAQIQTLRVFAKATKTTLAFISQIDRHFDPAQKPFPDLEDIRLPNALDLKLFDRACFLHNGEVRITHL